MKLLRLFSTFLLLTYSITNAHVQKTINTTHIHIMQGDIATLEFIDQGNYDTFVVDALVNAANTELSRGGGVCGALFQAAEGNGIQLQQYIKNNFPDGIKTGQAIMTPSFNLQKSHVKNIIHAVGPIYKNYSNKKEAEQLLINAYNNSLDVAQENKLSSIAFPFISSAIYGYPKPEAARIALETLIEFAKNNSASSITDIYMVLYSKEDYEIFTKLFTAL